MAIDFNKIKGLFIVQEETKKKPEAKQVRKEETTKKQVVNQKETTKQSRNDDPGLSQNTPPQPEISEGQLNPKIFENLTMAIGKANLPGEDYLEFMEALKALESLELSEDLKIKTVFSTLGTRGLTKAKILESADYYLQILQNEKTKFYEALRSQSDGQVKKKAEEIEHYKKEATAKSQQIEELSQQILQLKARIGELESHIAEAEAKIKSTENDFIFTFNKVANRIKTDIERIKNINL